jgi:hypothetical protein
MTDPYEVAFEGVRHQERSSVVNYGVRFVVARLFVPVLPVRELPVPELLIVFPRPDELPIVELLPIDELPFIEFEL